MLALGCGQCAQVGVSGVDRPAEHGIVDIVGDAQAKPTGFLQVAPEQLAIGHAIEDHERGQLQGIERPRQIEVIRDHRAATVDLERLDLLQDAVFLALWQIERADDGNRRTPEATRVGPHRCLPGDAVE